MHAYMHSCIHVCMHTCMHACIHAYMHTCMHVCMHTCMHTCIHAYMHACIHIHAYIHAYIRHCMHTYMHTCMQKCFKKNLSSALLARCCAKWPNAVLFEQKGGATVAPFPSDPPRVRQVKRFLKNKGGGGQLMHPGGGTPHFVQKPYVLPSGRRGV